MSRQALLDLLLSGGQSAARSRAFIDTIDDVAAAKLLAAAESGDMRSVMRAMADQTWGTAPARPVPQAPAPSGSRSPMSFEQRIAGDREIRRTIDSAGVPPAIRAAIDAGEPEAIMEAYRNAVRRGGVEDSIRELAKPADQVAAESIAGQFDRATAPVEFTRNQRQAALDSMRNNWPVPFDSTPDELMAALPELPQQHQRLIKAIAEGDDGNWLGFDYPSQAISAVLAEGPKNWDLSPAMRSAYDEYVSYFGSPSVRPSSLGPARQLDLPLSDDTRAAMDVAQEQSAAAAMFSPESGIRTASGEPAFNAWVRNHLDDSASVRNDAFAFDEVPPRPRAPTAPPRKSMRGRAAAAGAVGAGTAAYLLRPSGTAPATSEDSDVQSGGEADLAAETSPPPSILATDDVPEPTVVQAPVDYSMQARSLINRLNDMRRAAGGEVPEAPAMMAEINRLLAMGNKTRRATAVAAPQDDAGQLYQQAQSMIDQVNQMYRRGMSPNSPEVQRVMAQVRQLQARGDAIRNRRAG